MKIFVLGDIVNDYFLVFLGIDLFIVKIYIKEYLFGGLGWFCLNIVGFLNEKLVWKCF